MTADASRMVWRALADPTRRQILDLLREGPRTTGALCEPFAVSRYAVMKHLTVLVRAGLVTTRRRGRERWNHLNAVPIREIYERWVKRYEGCWAESVLRLRDQVERQNEEETMAAKAKTAAEYGVARIEMEIPIKADPKRVWAALTGDATGWWPRSFYAGESAKSMNIEPKLGGLMYEDWGNGDGLVWATIIAMEAPKLIQFIGHIAPPFGGPAITMLRITLRTEGDKTVLQLSDTVSGLLGEGQEGNTRDGWKILFDDGLRAYVESGAA